MLNMANSMAFTLLALGRAMFPPPLMATIGMAAFRVPVPPIP